jgi:hypothetical protein
MRYTPSQPGSGTTVPDGEYRFEVTNAEEKQSASSGNDMIELILKIENGPTVYDYLTATDGSQWKLDNFLASIGENVKPGVSVDIDPDSFIGRQGTCVLYTDTYQGKKKNKVADYVFVISEAAPKAVSQPTARSASDKWR